MIPLILIFWFFYAGGCQIFDTTKPLPSGKKKGECVEIQDTTKC